MINDHFRLLFTICLVLFLGLIGVAGYSAYTADNTNARLNENRQLIVNQEAGAARDDCRAKIESQFAEVVRTRDALGWSAIPALIGLHVDGVVPDLNTIATKLQAANAAVLALPLLDDAVNHGFTLNGVHYPACPRVPHS